MTDSDQQDYDKWQTEQQQKRIDELRRAARRIYGQASLLLDIGDSSARQTAERLPAAAARAFWHAEFTEYEDVVHREMDEYGHWFRMNFGCHLSYESGSYQQKCSIAIAHKRVGVSMGFTARTRLCAICGEDFADCAHLPSRLYEIQGGAGPTGNCRVCGGSNCTEHLPGETYKAAPVYIVTDIARVHEVSLVRRPSQPEARLTQIPVDTESLRKSLGSAFKPGVPVSCDLCLRQCNGIEEISGLES